VRLGSLTWPELHEPAGPRLLLLPLGATEQHGPHLPLETDSVIAAALAEAVAAQRSDVVVAPVLPYGSSGEHAGFPGTLSLGQEAFESAVVELVRSADAFDAVLLLSWHGGNAGPLGRAVERLRYEGRRVSAWRSRLAGGDLHAGRVETSLMLALAPDLVGEERPVGATGPLEELLPALRARGVKAVSPSGVLGDATGATAQEGRALLSSLVAELSASADALLADQLVPR
jgi:mycofactocin system creatininase family protein